MTPIGDNIRRHRKEKGLSQEAVALAIGSTKSAVSKYELGHRDPSLDTIQRISAVLDVPISELLWGDGNFSLYHSLAHALINKTNDREEPLTPQERIDDALAQMTEDGQNRVADYAEDILLRYRRQDIPTEQGAPEGPQEPSEDK